MRFQMFNCMLASLPYPMFSWMFLRLREKVLIRTSADSILKLLSSHPLDLIFAVFGHKTCRFIKTPRIDVARGLYLHILLACLLC